MALVAKLYEARDEVRAIGLKLQKLKNDNYTEVYNNGDIRYFDEMSRQLAMSAATIGTFIDHLDANAEQKKKFAALNTAENGPDSLPPSDYQEGN